MDFLYSVISIDEFLVGLPVKKTETPEQANNTKENEQDSVNDKCKEYPVVDKSIDFIFFFFMICNHSNDLKLFFNPNLWVGSW